ncbi:MAG: hypothetical protein ACFNZS_01380 [Ottowia sp.]
MDASTPIDPLFLALAQPVLRGPEGQAVTVTPGTGGAAIGARLWPRDDQGGVVYAWGHAAPQDSVPWLASRRRVWALLDGHRPLTVAPATGCGWPPNTPYPAVVSAQVGGLTVFFANTGQQVRVFAADAEQAVELEPVDDAQIFAAWSCAGQLWTAGMTSRLVAGGGKDFDFSQALLLRWNTRPLAVAARWQGRDLWRVNELATSAAGWSDVLGVEAWLAALPGAESGPRWLLGAPLTRGLHGPINDFFWMLGPPAPDDYVALLLARVDGLAAAAASEPPPLTLMRVLDGFSLVGCCGMGGSADGALVFTAQRDLERAYLPWPSQLHVSHWDGAAAQLGAPQPLSIAGLPPQAAQAILRDFDTIYHPAFGYAATLTWKEDEVPSATALLHSRDGRQWQVVQRLEPAPQAH